MEQHDWLADRFEENRAHLRAVAYRMLGSLSEAEDAVQESWIRLSRSDTSVVDNIGGWMTTIVARVCLNMLRSRRSGREEPLDGNGQQRARQRIERDLHDGMQQRLASLGLELRAADAIVPPGSDELRAQLARTADGLAAALEDLQEVSRGIHPAILSRGGLAPALKALGRRSAVPVELDIRVDGRLPEQVEVAVYYVVSEALTNAAKHAGASLVPVDLEVPDSVLRLAVRGDGAGRADPDNGSGLVGLRDRVEAIGGDLQLTSPPDEGTSLLVTIPIRGRPRAAHPLGPSDHRWIEAKRPSG
jgi:signal transduction histidine kinase